MMSKKNGVITKVYRLEDETAVFRPHKDKPQQSENFGDATKGGNTQFNWNSVKDMSYKDRECFLGYTTKIGVLDKGGKWKKRDWWGTLDDGQGPSADEIKRAKEEDARRIRVGLGLEVDTRHSDIPTMDAEKVRELTKKIKEEATAEAQEEQETAEFNYGLGFKAPDAGEKLKIAPGAVNNITTAFSLEAVGGDEVIPGLEIRPRQIQKDDRDSSSDSAQRARAPRSRSRDGKEKKTKKKKKRSHSSSSEESSEASADKLERKRAKKEKKRAEKKAKKLELELRKRYGL